MSSNSSYRTILRSSSIVGGAQAVNIAVSLLKMKFVAVLLGPAGIGLAGIYQSLVQTASSIAALGVGNVGTREIAKAEASGGEQAVGQTRRVLFWLTLILAVLGVGAFWLSSRWIARFVLEDEARMRDVEWLSIAVGLTVAAGSQGALLTGLRRIGDLARINLISGAIGAILGVSALKFWPEKGVLAMVLVAPIATFIFGLYFVSRLTRPEVKSIAFKEMSGEWQRMLTLGFAFMLSGLITTLAQLAVRTLVQRELGFEALGQFQAAWSIGLTYLGFVLGAMGTDFYPRLAAVIDDHEAATKLVNDQTEVALLLCGPVILAMLGLAPLVIKLLYTSKFESAVEILRWQLLGDIIKVMSWPLGFVLLAAGAGKTYILSESLGIGVLLLGVLIGLPLLGVTATGVAFLALYVAYLPMVWWFARRMIDFCWTRAVKVQALAVMVAAVAVDITARCSEMLSAFVGVGLALAMVNWALKRLSVMVYADDRPGRIARLAERVKGWKIRQ